MNDIIENVKGALGVLQAALLATASKTEDDKLEKECYLLDDICRGIRQILSDVETKGQIGPVGCTYIQKACKEYNDK